LLTINLPKEISSIFSSDSSYYSYFDHTSVKSVQNALLQLDDYISNEGPFDGLLAFSQGAGLGAMYLVQNAKDKRNSTPPFKCAIFLSSMVVYDASAYEERSEVRVLDPSTDGEPVQIPTVHVWGKGDGRAQDSETLSKLCSRRGATVFVHDGGHEVPGLSIKGAVPGTVKAMRRGIAQALLA
jgi:hypothetical protein